MNKVMNQLLLYLKMSLFYSPLLVLSMQPLKVTRKTHDAQKSHYINYFLVLNRPLPNPRSIAPTDFLNALERKFGGRINRDQQVKN